MTAEHKDFSSLISGAVAERMTAEYVEAQVLARVDKLIADAVDSALRSYSDTGKLIEGAVKDALKVDNLDLPSYGETVCAILRKQIEDTVAPLVAGRLAEDMQELLSLAPKEVKLSEIVAAMIKSRTDWEDSLYGPVVTCIVERSDYGSAWVYLDPNEPDQGKYKCDFRLLVGRDGVISSATVEEVEVGRGKSPSIGRTYGVGQMIRAYVACGTKMILDEDEVCISVGDY